MVRGAKRKRIHTGFGALSGLRKNRYICPNRKVARKMNIEEFRDYCLSLAGAGESMPWQNGRNEYNRGFLCFSVAGK